MKRLEKRILVAGRLRCPPREGFSWIDRRFMHDVAPCLGRDAVFLYLFLSTVSDKWGLSYYKDETIADRTGIGMVHLPRAREELLHRDLIAYEPPLYQVLSLPERRTDSGPPIPLGRLLSRLAAAHREGGGA